MPQPLGAINYRRRLGFRVLERDVEPLRLPDEKKNMVPFFATSSP
jgi:hypothetical protein